MDITTPFFFIFLLIFISLYYLFPPKFREIPLFLANCLFLLTFDVNLLALMLCYVSINFILISLLIHSKNTSLKRSFFIFSIILNICLLFFYKYTGFLYINLLKISNHLHLNITPQPPTIVPLLGVSFFTFKTLSIFFDIYKKPIKNISLLSFCTYTIFFPEFLSGPIDRFTNFSNSLKSQTNFSSSRFFQGLVKILHGLFKKTVIANNISLLITPIIGNIYQYQGFDLLLTTYLFSFQLFFDFSGYTDIAIGIGKIIGFNVPENFDFPYLATNIKEFWRKWHITLSSWFKDYLYIPLGGNRKGISRQIFNILFVFLVTGAWHGASWNFIFWGLLHGLYQVTTLTFNRLLGNHSFIKNLNPLVSKITGIFLTFNFVTLAWIFFYAKSFKEALYIIRNLSFLGYNANNHSIFTFYLIISIISFFLFYALKKFAKLNFVNLTINLIIIISLLLFSQTKSQDFLYFKF